MNVFIPLVWTIVLANPTPCAVTVLPTTDDTVLERSSRACIQQGSAQWKEWLASAPAPVLELDRSTTASSVDFKELSSQYGAVVTGDARLLSKGIREGLDGYYLEGHMPTLFVVILDTPNHEGMIQWVMGKAALKEPTLPLALQTWIDNAPYPIYVEEPYSNPDDINWNALVSGYSGLITTQYDIVVAAQERGLETYNIKRCNRSFYIILLNPSHRSAMISWIFGNKSTQDGLPAVQLKNHHSYLTQPHIPELISYLERSPFALYELPANVKDPHTIDWKTLTEQKIKDHYDALVTQQWAVVASALDFGLEVYEAEKKHVNVYQTTYDTIEETLYEKVYFIILDTQDKELVKLWITSPDVFNRTWINSAIKSTRTFLPFLPSSVRVAKLSPQTLLSEMGKESWKTLALYCDVVLLMQKELAQEARSLGWYVHWLKKEELYAVVLQTEQSKRDMIIEKLIAHNQQ